MLFIAQLTHPPELCFARPEHKDKLESLREYMQNKDKLEKEVGVKVHGAYVNSNEHTFFMVLETDNYANISKFLGGPMLTHHTAKITPVITMRETMAISRTIAGEKT
jgi:hypothetical protein